MTNSTGSEKRKISPLAKVSFFLACFVVLSPILSIFIISGMGLHWYSRSWYENIALVILNVATFAIPVSLIIGIAARIQIDRNRSKFSGTWMAVIGMYVPFLLILPILFIGGGIARAPQSRSTACQSNLKQLGIGVNMYIQDHNDIFPDPKKWNDSVRIYLRNKNALICPETWNEIPSYAMNAQLKGFHGDDVADPEHTVMLFESIEGKNRYGGPELLPREPCHNGYNVLFADYHAEKVSLNEVRKLNWDPHRKVSVSGMGNNH